MVFTHPGGPPGRAVDVIGRGALLKHQDFQTLRVKIPTKRHVRGVVPDLHYITGWPRVTSILLLSLYTADRRVRGETCYYLRPLCGFHFIFNCGKFNPFDYGNPFTIQLLTPRRAPDPSLRTTIISSHASVSEDAPMGAQYQCGDERRAVNRQLIA